MNAGLEDLMTSTFRTTRTADKICADLNEKLGWKSRYVAARLALGRSLSHIEQPPELTSKETEEMATPMRGMQLFGEGAQAAVWLAIITEHSSETEMTKRSLQGLVSRHWHRGAFLLGQDWNDCGCAMDKFVARLAELADFSGDGGGSDTISAPSAPTYAEEIRLPVGEIAHDLQSGEQVTFSLNGEGGSPHMAIMGGVGSGKTRTAVHMLRMLRQYCELPLLAFDFKGDLADRLVASFGATVVSPPEEAIPLDVLYITSRDDILIKTSAGRIRDSIAKVKRGRVGGIQLEALREAVESALRHGPASTPATLPDVASALKSGYEDRNRPPDELTVTLNELTQFVLFEPKFSPAEFFSKSWIIQLPQGGSEEMRRLIINLTLDALDRWINSQPDAPTDDRGVRALRHLTMLDEAHVILSTKLPALGNLVRMSRSKGGSIMLISQSPDDFERAEDGYLDNMGMTLAFNTQAKPGPIKRIFVDNTCRLTSLKAGEAMCRLRLEARTQKILCWKPED